MKRDKKSIIDPEIHTDNGDSWIDLIILIVICAILTIVYMIVA